MAYRHLFEQRSQCSGLVTEAPHRVGAPTRRAFDAAGYTTLEDLFGADEDGLLAMRGAEPKATRIVYEEADRPLENSPDPAPSPGPVSINTSQ